MSENVELAKRFVAAHNRGDIDAMLAACHADVELDWSRSGGPEPDVYRGRDAIRRVAEGYREVFDEILLEPEEFIDAGDDVVIPNVGTVRHREGITATVPSVFICTIKDGLIVRMQMFNRRDEAFEAAGLPG